MPGGSDDLELVEATIEALLGQIDALNASIGRAQSTKVRESLLVRKDKLHAELDAARAAHVEMMGPPSISMAAMPSPFGMASTVGAAEPSPPGPPTGPPPTAPPPTPSAHAAATSDELDEPPTEQSHSPFAAKAAAESSEGSTPDTLELKRETSTQESADSQRLVVMASTSGNTLTLDSRLRAGPGLQDLSGAPGDVQAIAHVLCNATEPVRVRDLLPSTQQSLERLLQTLRRLVMLRLVEIS